MSASVSTKYGLNLLPYSIGKSIAKVYLRKSAKMTVDMSVRE